MNTGAEVRRACRAGSWTGPTPGLAPGFEQANLVMLPDDWAFDFLLFCQRNPQACPIITVTDPGDFCPADVAPGADLRTDLPRYRVWRDGHLHSEPIDVQDAVIPRMVSFLI
ncbi:MAG: DUF1445 domain-containing protein, partial [Gemmataceae bacterium]